MVYATIAIQVKAYYVDLATVLTFCEAALLYLWPISVLCGLGSSGFDGSKLIVGHGSV